MAHLAGSREQGMEGPAGESRTGKPGSGPQAEPSALAQVPRAPLRRCGALERGVP